MSASLTANKYGMTVKEMAELSNKSKRTLFSWYKSNPQLFNVVLAGCYQTKLGKDNG